MKSGWRAEVARRGIRASKTLPTKTEAKDWAARREFLILQGKGSYGPGTLGDLFDRYAREVSPKKRGARWEQFRLENLARDELAAISVRDVRPGDFAAWRDRRLEEVAPGTVIREMTLLSAVMTVARKEWGLVGENPLRDVRKPSPPPPRDRRVSDAEIAALTAAAGPDLRQATARAVHAFRFAVATGMRAGEIAGLAPARIKGRIAHLPLTKNGARRDVPLSMEALGLLEELPELDPVFGLKPSQIDVLFRKARERAGIEGLNFHDSRREFISRASKKVDVLALARIVGHRDIKQLMTYYQQPVEDLARLLDG